MIARKMLGHLLKLSHRHLNVRNHHTLLVDKIDSVLHLKLNRPDQRNALNYETISRLNDELARFEEDNALKSVVLVGSGGNFCCGLDPNEIRNDRTLLALSKLIRSFPLNKPSIAALEGYASCVGLQLALVCDYRIVEEDTKLQLDEKLHLPLHPHVKQLHMNHDLIAMFQNTAKDFGLNSSFIKHLVQQHLITKNVTMGCCFGVSLELGKCIEKFALDAIMYDRKKLHDDVNSRIDLFDVLNEHVCTRTRRFLNDGIGKHGASNTDTLEEIYERWTPKLVQEKELTDAR